MNTLVVLTDLGTFKAFALEKGDGRSGSPRLQPVQATRMEEGDDRIGRRVSDQAGQYRKSTNYSADSEQSDGEQHNIWLENERRSVKEIAETISDLLSDSHFESCYLAAPSEINRTIVEHLTPPARAKIEKNLQCDLVNAQRNEILQRFND
jgi:hypothetical protein